MKSKVLKIFCVLLFFVFADYVIGQSSQISPKLDFDDTESKENSSVPVVPGVIQTWSNEQSGGGPPLDADTSIKTGPKIHGVRVTVDTGDNPKYKESKESAELSEGGKHKKRVGIHTDITFEITSDGVDDTNATNSAQQGEDASVPIYKGRGGSTSKPRKSYDPKTRWNTNFSSERRSYGSSERRGLPTYGSYYPQYPQYVPKRHGLDDVRRGGGMSKEDGWHSYIPTANAWTTERYRIELYRPNVVNGLRTPSWKPCYCMSSETDSRRRRENNHGFDTTRPAISVMPRVDSKLERPFSKK